MATGDIAAIITIVAMVGAVLIIVKGGFMEKLRSWLKPKKCPKCKAGKVLEIVYGHPSGEPCEFDDVYWGGCCIFGHDPKLHCASCHWQWGNGSKGAYCEDSFDDDATVESVKYL
jgi:hypothetical protein